MLIFWRKYCIGISIFLKKCVSSKAYDSYSSGIWHHGVSASLNCVHKESVLSELLEHIILLEYSTYTRYPLHDNLLTICIRQDEVYILSWNCCSGLCRGI